MQYHFTHCSYTNECTHNLSLASEHEVRGESQLSGGHGCGSGVVGLDTTTGEDTVAALLEGVGQQELQLTHLQGGGEYTV